MDFVYVLENLLWEVDGAHLLFSSCFLIHTQDFSPSHMGSPLPVCHRAAESLVSGITCSLIQYLYINTTNQVAERNQVLQVNMHCNLIINSHIYALGQ